MYHVIIILLFVKSLATIQLGRIQNVSWVLNSLNRNEYMNLSNTTCNQCLCRMFAMDNIVTSIACQQNLKTCQLLFWNATVPLQTDKTSTVYFQTIPSFLQTTENQQPMTISIISKKTTTTTSTTSTTTTRTTSTKTSTTSTRTTSTTTTTAVPIFLINPGGESGSLDPWMPSSSSAPILDTGIANGANVPPHSGFFAFNGGPGGGTLQQKVPLTNIFSNAQLDSGLLYVSVSFWERTWSLSSIDTGAVILNFLSATKTSIRNVSTSPTFCTSSWCQVTGKWPLPVGTRTIDYMMKFVAIFGDHADAWIDDNILSVG